ncbi:hypothetical protein CgunFtcFv8_016128 [Champsocephalus gunnari]|uniref:Uncharacterized protein n=1 Tax=Champsocephalus gunnari TaxID=52237 RepID=A0AAN8CQ57_CHAGU|nr:hypothetical protein CgunFtcFv8_016128 [Champsocephalus gunnari]
MKPSWLPLAELSSSPQKKRNLTEETWIRGIFAQLPLEEIINGVATRRIEIGTNGPTSGTQSFNPQLCKVKISVDQRR